MLRFGFWNFDCLAATAYMSASAAARSTAANTTAGSAATHTATGRATADVTTWCGVASYAAIWCRAAIAEVVVRRSAATADITTWF